MDYLLGPEKICIPILPIEDKTQQILLTLWKEKKYQSNFCVYTP